MMSDTERSVWHLYIHQGKAYVPHVALTDAGFFLEVEPLTVVSLENQDAVEKAICEAITAGNPLVRAPLRDEYPPRRIPRGARLYEVNKTQYAYEFPELEKASNGGWVETGRIIQQLPIASPIPEVARRLIELARGNQKPAAAQRTKTSRPRKSAPKKPKP